jgi:hypothetical protein
MIVSRISAVLNSPEPIELEFCHPRFLNSMLYIATFLNELVVVIPHDSSAAAVFAPQTIVVYNGIYIFTFQQMKRK